MRAVTAITLETLETCLLCFNENLSTWYCVYEIQQ